MPLKQYFKILTDFIIGTVTFFQSAWDNVVKMWEFDATSRAYSRPILRSAIERCPLLQKLYKAYHENYTKWWNKVEGWIFFQKECPFWPISNAALNFQNMPWPGESPDKTTPDINFIDEAVL